jgi:hypothetical protein
MPFLVKMDLAFENISEEDMPDTFQQLRALEEVKFYNTMKYSGQL